jgi:hydrogenase expression/formation protein HypC
MRLVEVEGNQGMGELGGLRRKLNLSLMEGASVGDYVIVHAGYAIERLEEEIARQTIHWMSTLGKPGNV